MPLGVPVYNTRILLTTCFHFHEWRITHLNHSYKKLTCNLCRKISSYFFHFCEENIDWKWGYMENQNNSPHDLRFLTYLISSLLKNAVHFLSFLRIICCIKQWNSRLLKKSFLSIYHKIPLSYKGIFFTIFLLFLLLFIFQQSSPSIATLNPTSL